MKIERHQRRNLRTWRGIDAAIKNNLYGKGVSGEGNKNAKVVLIGEAPGKEESLYGRPFIGRQGRMLRKVLEEAGLDLKDIYITNAVKVRPPDNRRPTNDEIDYWRPVLMAELALINPEQVICLGNTARRALYSRPREAKIIFLPHPGRARFMAGVREQLGKKFKTIAERLKDRKDSIER